MSDSSRVRVSIVAEPSYGETPATPTMLCLPITGVDIKNNTQYVESQVISDSRDVEDLVRIDRGVTGTIPCELRYSPSGGGLNAAIAATLCSSFASAVTTAGCDYVGGSNTLTRASGSFTADGYEVGHIIKVSGYSGSTAAQFRRLATVGTLSSTFEGDALGDLDDASVTVAIPAPAKNGTLTPSFTIEVAYLDLQIAEVFTGCVFASADFNLSLGQLATVTFSIEGQSSTRILTNTGTTDQFIAGATYSAAALHPTLDPISLVEISGGGVDYAASSIAMTWNNSVRSRKLLGTLGTVSVARGKFAVGGRISAYFEDFGDHEDYAENEASDLWWASVDENGRGYAFSYPQTKLSDVSAPVNGSNADITKTVAMTAYKDPTELCTVRVHRID